MSELHPLPPVDPAIEPEYVFSNRYPERTQVYAWIATRSEQARVEWPVLADLAYGAHPRERLDLFPAAPGAPLLIFIHGGYWSSHDKSSFSYVAPPFLKRGFAVAIVGYPLAPETPIAGIVRSVRVALRWLTDERCSPLTAVGPVYVCGHSAGGHLAVAASLERPGPAVEPVGPEDDSEGAAAGPRVAGCAPLSGIFDLRPLVHTSIAGRTGLAEAQAPGLSPSLAPPPRGWLLVGAGGSETAAFLAQTSDYVRHCRALGAEASTLVLPGANHYTVLLDLARDDGLFIAAIHSRARQDLR